MAPTPYLVMDGHGLVVLGTCDAAALKPAFDAQQVHPVLTESGRGILILFICDFAQASHGPHLEFHVTALAAPTPGTTLRDAPEAALAALATQHEWGVLSLHLFNDTANVVAYNSEYLGLQAQLCSGAVDVSAAHVGFSFAQTDGAEIASGNMRLNKRSDAGAMWQVLRRLGGQGLWDAMRKRPARAHVINRISDVVPRNGRALTLTAPDQMLVTRFAPDQDRLTLSGDMLTGYGFTPTIFEHVWPFRFVYVHPDDA